MDFALYIHIPWCVRKCPYCDFNSHEYKDAIPEAEYVQALLLDLEQDLPLVWGRRISSLFIGGGTPSLFSAEAIDTLLSGIRARVPVVPTAEITLEANPGTVEQHRFAEYRSAGINRLSIGIQSYQDAQLQALGRIHAAHDARLAVESAKSAGFTNINQDLMFALPGQCVADAELDVRTAVALETTHISYYQLTLEPNTRFFQFPPSLPGDDDVFAMQSAGQRILADAGFHQYEVSAYARAQQVCQHNLNYWRFGDYLGIGAGAHGKITDFTTGVIRRYAKTRQPKAYLRAVPKAEQISDIRELGREDIILEFMMNALRLHDGFQEREFVQATGLAMDDIAAVIQAQVDGGMLVWQDGNIKTSDLGARFLDDLLQCFTYT